MSKMRIVTMPPSLGADKDLNMNHKPDYWDKEALYTYSLSELWPEPRGSIYSALINSSSGLHV